MKTRIAFRVHDYRSILWGTSGVWDQLANYDTVGSQGSASNSLVVTGQGGIEHLVPWFLVLWSSETETAYTDSALALVDLVQGLQRENTLVKDYLRQSAPVASQATQVARKET